MVKAWASSADSFVVDAEYNTGAEKRSILVGPRGVVVVLLVPQALAGDAHSLAQYLPDYDLAHNFVTRNAQLLDLLLNLSDD